MFVAFMGMELKAHGARVIAHYERQAALRCQLAESRQHAALAIVRERPCRLLRAREWSIEIRELAGYA